MAPNPGGGRNIAQQTTRPFCPYCPTRRFVNRQSIRDHFKTVHQKAYCQICNLDFGHPHSLIDHIQWNHEPDSPEWDVIRRGGTPSEISRVREASQLSPQQLSVEHTKVPHEEHDAILQGLLSRCHSTSRLQMQNYIMPVSASAFAQNTMLPANESARNGPVESNHPGDLALQNPRQDCPNMARPTKPKKRHALPPELFKLTPQSSPVGEHGKLQAVALDCEMVEITTCFSELAYLSAVDFLTGEVLIDSFVAPTGTVVNWRTKTSGINAKNMSEALKTGNVLPGWHAARDKLWEFVDDQTVLVGHALENDLRVLGIFHTRIVDSSVVTAEAVFNTLQPDGRLPRLWALKKLAKALLNRDIQTSDKGHYALQDAYAARDIVLCAIQTPQILAKWALVARKIEQRKQEERERAIEEARKKREEAASQVMMQRAEVLVTNSDQLTLHTPAQMRAFTTPAQARLSVPRDSRI